VLLLINTPLVLLLMEFTFEALDDSDFQWYILYLTINVENIHFKLGCFAQSSLENSKYQGC
jgi:hypothetical protein